MGNPLDRLFQGWHQLGGAVLLAESGAEAPVRSPEAVIAESAAYCRESGRPRGRLWRCRGCGGSGLIWA